MVGTPNGAGVGICALALVTGCAAPELGGGALCGIGAPGDLVFTEIHANPDGSDGDAEYIELYNASGRLLDLQGWMLVSSRSDGTGAQTHRFGHVEVGPLEYLVVGNASAEPLPAHLDYSYGSSLGSLRNSDAVVSIECGRTQIDVARYTATRDGRALQLDGRLEPDGEANDLADNWCMTGDDHESTPGNFGTPGAENPPCSEDNDPVLCPGSSGVSLAAPVDEDVHITEWMANPAGPDGELEWVEVLFDEAADLADIQLGTSIDSLGSKPFGGSCFPVDAGARVVFGASPAAAPRVDAELGFSLGNRGPRNLVVAVADRTLARVSYEGATEGIAWQTDEEQTVCLVEAVQDHEYAAANFGTPGAPNPPCAPSLQDGMCFDEGVPRAIRRPRAGAVQITEWLANPAAVGHRDGEWVEVRFEEAADLNGLVWSDLATSAPPVGGDDCLAVPAAAHVVFARNPEGETNGGIPMVGADLGISLNNQDETITLSHGDQVLDSISYAASTSGVATQIDEWGVFCEANTPYGSGDLGTPGAPNPACP